MINRRTAWLSSMVVALTLGMMPAANAFSLQTSGTWDNIVPDGFGTISGEGTDTISWGTPATGNGQSGYNFAGVTEDVQISDLVDTDFLLGTFTHNNFPIYGTSLDEATLNIDFALGSNSTEFSFLFEHFETPNSPGWGQTCAAGGVAPCPDLVSFPNSTSQEVVSINGVDYNLTLTGFSQNGPDNAIDSFLTLEDEANSAGLYAQLTQVPGADPIPEPATLLGLFGLGTLGLGGALKRQ